MISSACFVQPTFPNHKIFNLKSHIYAREKQQIITLEKLEPANDLKDTIMHHMLISQLQPIHFLLICLIISAIHLETFTLRWCVPCCCCCSAWLPSAVSESSDSISPMNKNTFCIKQCVKRKHDNALHCFKASHLTNIFKETHTHSNVFH